MKQSHAILAAAAVVGLWLWRSRTSTPAGPVTVNAAPNIVTEDDTGEALRDLLLQLGKDPNRQVDLSFVGAGIDVNFISRPWVERRTGIPGQPQINIP